MNTVNLQLFKRLNRTRLTPTEGVSLIWRLLAILIFYCCAAFPMAIASQISSNTSVFAVKNEAAFFESLNLSQPELVAVSNAVHVRD